MFGGGGERGARVSEFFLQRIQIYKKNMFFQGAGGALKEGTTRVSEFFLQRIQIANKKKFFFFLGGGGGGLPFC